MDLDIILMKYLSNTTYTCPKSPSEKRIRLLAFYIIEFKELDNSLNALISTTSGDNKKAYHLGFTTGMIQLIIEEMQNEHDVLVALQNNEKYGVVD